MYLWNARRKMEQNDAKVVLGGTLAPTAAPLVRRGLYTPLSGRTFYSFFLFFVEGPSTVPVPVPVPGETFVKKSP